MSIDLNQARISGRFLPNNVYQIFRNEDLIDSVSQEVLLDAVRLNCIGKHVVSNFIRKKLCRENQIKCHLCRTVISSNDFERQPAIDARIREIWQNYRDIIGFSIEKYRERVLNEQIPNMNAVTDYNREMLRQDDQDIVDRFGRIRQPFTLPPSPVLPNENRRVNRNLGTAFNNDNEPGAREDTDDLFVQRNRFDSNPPLHRAVKEGNLDQVQRLIESEDVNSLNDDKETPLHIAAGQGHLRSMRLLIDHGANINAVDEVGNTPLHFVRNRLSANLLLENRADMDISNNRGESPVFKVLKNNHLDVAERLISNGCIIDRNNHCRDSLLHIAARKNAENIIRALLDRGAFVNAVNRKGWTPLFEAIHKGNLEAFNALIGSSDIHRLDLNGNTALHVAAFTYHVRSEIINELLRREINTNVTNRQGRLALNIQDNE